MLSAQLQPPGAKRRASQVVDSLLENSSQHSDIDLPGMQAGLERCPRGLLGGG
jgi:hypothetical protein